MAVEGPGLVWLVVILCGRNLMLAVFVLCALSAVLAPVKLMQVVSWQTLGLTRIESGGWRK